MTTKKANLVIGYQHDPHPHISMSIQYYSLHVVCVHCVMLLVLGVGEHWCWVLGSSGVGCPTICTGVGEQVDNSEEGVTHDLRT